LTLLFKTSGSVKNSRNVSFQRGKKILSSEGMLLCENLSPMESDLILETGNPHFDVKFLIFRHWAQIKCSWVNQRKCAEPVCTTALLTDAWSWTGLMAPLPDLLAGSSILMIFTPTEEPWAPSPSLVFPVTGRFISPIICWILYLDVQCAAQVPHAQAWTHGSPNIPSTLSASCVPILLASHSDLWRLIWIFVIIVLLCHSQLSTTKACQFYLSHPTSMVLIKVPNISCLNFTLGSYMYPTHLSTSNLATFKSVLSTWTRVKNADLITAPPHTHLKTPQVQP
jgi:hypothetical protein